MHGLADTINLISGCHECNRNCKSKPNLSEEPCFRESSGKTTAVPGTLEELLLSTVYGFWIDCQTGMTRTNHVNVSESSANFRNPKLFLTPH
jgi:hypothetical protein